ncbi:MAG: hypothetical protein HYS36_08935 [Candidatus Rokubacteria bacterium]|nr:hypothetical protein [Candidatus Rokubacteria bacterium]
MKTGEIVQVRTPDGVTSARVIRHEILGFDVQPGTLIVAVAEPHPPAAVADVRLVIAARRLPACRAPCVLRKPGPHQTIASRVRTLFPRGPDLWVGAGRPGSVARPQQKLAKLIIAGGHFTARERRQYVAYARYGAEAEPQIDDDWRTVILDSDLSVVAVLGGTYYRHIVPLGVADVNGDGLDEVWAALDGHEGDHAGIFYWRGGRGQPTFGKVATKYHGL